MRDLAFRTLVDILLIDDNEEDVVLLRKVLDRSRIRKALHVVESGEDALRFLRRESPYEQAPRPKIILLDQFLPGISGLDVLKEAKSDEALRAIPVIFFSSSDAEDDVTAAYDGRACAFITKPGDRALFEEAVERIEAFWLNTAQLPLD